MAALEELDSYHTELAVAADSLAQDTGRSTPAHLNDMTLC